MSEQQRTQQQNKALHKWCEELATELNNAGISVPVLLKNLEVDITKHLIKDMIRAIGKKKYGKESTAHLTTTELHWCIEEMYRHLGNPDIAMSVPFPDITQKTLLDYYSKQ